MTSVLLSKYELVLSRKNDNVKHLAVLFFVDVV